MGQEEEGEQEQEQQQHRHEPFRSPAALASRQGAAAGSRGWVSASWPPQALRPQTQDMFGLQARLCGSGTTARQTSSWSFGTNRTNIKTRHKCLRTQGYDKGQCSDSGTSCAAAAARLAIIRLAALEQIRVSGLGQFSADEWTDLLLRVCRGRWTQAGAQDCGHPSPGPHRRRVAREGVPCCRCASLYERLA